MASSDISGLLGGAQQMVAQPADQASQMANQMQDLQDKQTKQQEMQQQLTDTKFQSLVSRIQTQNGIQDPVVRAQVAKANDKAGIAYPGFFQDLHKSDDLQNGSNAALNMLAGNPVSNDDKVAGLKAVMDPTAAHGLFDMYKNKQAQEAAASVAGIKASAGISEAQIRADAVTKALGARIEQGDQRIHNQNVKTIVQDPMIQKQMTGLNNLANAGSMLDGSLPINPELFAEAQQTVRANLGIKGNSGVGERGATMLDGVGMKEAELSQFLSMHPEDIEKYGGTPFVQHVQALLAKVQDNTRKQVQNKVDTFASSHGSFYKGRPDLKEDFNNFTQNYHNLINNQAPTAGVGEQPPTASAPSPQASLNKKQQSYVTKLQTMVNPATKQNYTNEEALAAMQQHNVK